ncbi:TetR/AcrR family transcriptional regulator [Rhodococcus sp. NPDC056960]|uniref:TetR/AcrR family transcriptional regulator n=1 Tax=Rhodococcus sp. NPDC056960 TaxID=3345982 RepID=UPI0036411B43
MPKVVNRQEREREIARAAQTLIAEGGFAAISLRAIAQTMGGSMTLVTHFYKTREELMRGIFKQMLVNFQEDLDEREEGATPLERLHILLEWLLPLDEDSRHQEQGRVLLAGGTRTEPHAQEFLDLMEKHMTGLLRDHLQGLVSPAEVEPVVAALRAVTNGIQLSAIEHPDKWPPEQQVAVLHRILGGLGLGVS